MQRGPATGLRWHRRLIDRGWTHIARLGNELIGAARPSMASIGFSDVSGSVDSSTITQCTTTPDGRSTGLPWDMWASAASERGQGGLERAGSIPRSVRKMEIVSAQRFRPRANRRDHEPRFRSRVRPREPVEWPPLGVGDRQDEDVLLVFFERDYIGESLDAALRISGSAARVPGHAR